MKELEIKIALKSAIKNFEEKYPEWADYKLAPKKDNLSVEVISDGDKLDIQAAKELLRDFAVELKKQNLMVTSQHRGDFTVGEYIYTFEEGLEDLADELEFKLGNYFSNLSISAQDNKPYIRFVYIGSLTSKDKEKVLDQVKVIADQYKPIDPNDIFSDVEFEELDEVLQEIEGKDFDDMVPSDYDQNKATDIAVPVSELKNLGYVGFKFIASHVPVYGNQKTNTVIIIDSKNKYAYKTNLIKEKDNTFGYENGTSVEFTQEEKEMLEEAGYAIQKMKEKAKDKKLFDGQSEGYTCEDIAEMHGVDLDFIMEQLEKGIEIEMEHTDNPEEAKAIAKDHLFEIPDYYDRLEQMEEQAEEEPMFSDGTEDEDDHFTIDSKEKDYEGEMAIVQLRNIISDAKSLLKVLSEDSELPAWVQSKLTLAEHNLKASCDYILKGLSPEEMMEEQEEMFADDKYGIKENIPITPENYESIWDAELDLVKTIDEGNYKKARPLFDFIYNFDILTAAETMGQFEDLWNRKEKYKEEIYNLYNKYHNYIVKENIKVTPENDELIWSAELDLVKAIDEGNYKKAESLFDFIYNFDILTAAETMGQFEDLWNRKEKYLEDIYELSLYEMYDEYDN